MTAGTWLLSDTPYYIPSVQEFIAKLCYRNIVMGIYGIAPTYAMQIYYYIKQPEYSKCIWCQTVVILRMGWKLSYVNKIFP